MLIGVKWSYVLALVLHAAAVTWAAVTGNLQAVIVTGGPDTVETVGGGLSGHGMLSCWPTDNWF